MLKNTDEKLQKAYDAHAWTWAWLTWLSIAGIIVWFHFSLEIFMPRKIAEIVDIILYGIEFYLIFAIGFLHSFFLRKLTK
ncbi:hypothetical protein V2K77_01805 [Pseudomonas alliivorans]|nr:hypothetical protein [Pseudomonas alliivorans]MEE4710204.1 hypothetical protein [Pseudomonas alliivorans]MEE4725189.1 hypothetical protein [Pseudomonas alliivorans]MEE4765950.1 hypothetical protein [Pseudomonas alliivorans]